MPKSVASSIPPPSEWDFRKFSESTVPLAIEYEYARSSNYRVQIEQWLQGDFWNAVLFDPFYLDTLRAAKLIRYSKHSIFAECVAHSRLNSDGLKHFERGIELSDKARLGWPSLRKTPATVREGMRRLHELIRPEGSSDHVFTRLRDSLPPIVRDYHLDQVALTLERFPEPFAVTLVEQDKAYFQRRLQKESSETAPLVDITTRPIDYCEVLASDPVLGHHEFIINWSCKPDEIRSAFASWLAERHPASRKGVRAKAARLKWLAAYRLSNSGLSFDEAQKILKAHQRNYPVVSDLDVLPVFQQRGEWDKAVRKVKADLNKNFINTIRSDF